MSAKTHFGYKQIDIDDKASMVKSVFDSVAGEYDVMNDLMSLGIHRLWKRYTAHIANIQKNARILDVASGSGDLGILFHRYLDASGELYLTDINPSMLSRARTRLTDLGLCTNVHYAIADAETLPFPENYFDLLSIGFGLRNVTNKENALRSMYRVLKPGGRLMVLEFSKPTLPGLQPIYDWYSFKLLPLMGKVIANDADSYQYLAESIRMHPAQNELKTMIEAQGFEDCTYHNLSGGIVALHTAYKY